MLSLRLPPFHSRSLHNKTHMNTHTHTHTHTLSLFLSLSLFLFLFLSLVPSLSVSFSLTYTHTHTLPHLFLSLSLCGSLSLSFSLCLSPFVYLSLQSTVCLSHISPLITYHTHSLFLLSLDPPPSLSLRECEANSYLSCDFISLCLRPFLYHVTFLTLPVKIFFIFV
jgi:hypothetical protein